MDPVSLIDALPAGDLLDSLTSYGVKDVSQLAKMFKDTKVSYDSSIRVPGTQATEAEMSTYYRKIGRPETPEGYSIPEQVSGSTLQQTLSELRGAAHQSGITAKQWEQIASNVGKQAEVESSRNTEMESEWETKARASFGDRLDSVKATNEKIIGQLSEGDDALKVLLSEVGKHPKVMEAFNKIAEITAPDTAPGITLEGSTALEPIDEARSLANEVRSIHASDAYSQKNHPGHEVAVDSFYRHARKLQELGYSGATDPRLAFDYISPQR